MTPSGALTTLYSSCLFNADCADGNYPLALMLATDGNFYGLTGNGGGASGSGTIFQITPSGSPTTEHDFVGTTAMSVTTPITVRCSSKIPAPVATVPSSASMGLGPFVKTLPTSSRGGSARQDPGKQPDGGD